jgi:murein L,D-transpeptidase YafK
MMRRAFTILLLSLHSNSRSRPMGILRYACVFLLIVIVSCEPKENKVTSSTPEVDTAVNEVEHTQNTIQLVVKDWVNPDHSLKKILDSLKIQPGKISILITKSEYELGVYYDSLLIKSYPVVFGGNPVDDKLRRGDKCTPEGIFKVKSKYEHKKWSRFIWINYPNEDSWKKHNDAISNGIIPKKADIGGEIGIHGVPNGYDFAVDYRQNWTLGCISMKNSDVIELFPFLTSETTIEIKK